MYMVAVCIVRFHHGHVVRMVVRDDSYRYVAMLIRVRKCDYWV